MQQQCLSAKVRDDNRESPSIVSRKRGDGSSSSSRLCRGSSLLACRYCLLLVSRGRQVALPSSRRTATLKMACIPALVGHPPPIEADRRSCRAFRPASEEVLKLAAPRVFAYSWNEVQACIRTPIVKILCDIPTMRYTFQELTYYMYVRRYFQYWQYLLLAALHTLVVVTAVGHHAAYARRLARLFDIGAEVEAANDRDRRGDSRHGVDAVWRFRRVR
jgi:hypothetical protein